MCFSISRKYEKVRTIIKFGNWWIWIKNFINFSLQYYNAEIGLRWYSSFVKSFIRCFSRILNRNNKRRFIEIIFNIYFKIKDVETRNRFYRKNTLALLNLKFITWSYVSWPNWMWKILSLENFIRINLLSW